MTFEGFPPAGLDFLHELAEHNNRTWFTEHRDRYVSDLQAPALAFVEEVGAQLRADHAELQFSAATNGSGSLMRINRDVRFSADKSPYKTAVAGMWWLGDGKKTQRPAYGFHLEADRMRLMGGMFRFDPKQLARYREAVVDDGMGGRLAAIVDAVEADSGCEVGGEHYKRTPRGMPADHPRERLLRFAGLHVLPQELTEREVTSERVVEFAVDRLRSAKPVVEWLCEVID